MDDLISRKAAIDALEWKWAGKAAIDAIKNLPSAQPEVRTQMSSADCISRQAAIETIRKLPNAGHWFVSANAVFNAVFDALLKLPSVQPELVNRLRNNPESEWVEIVRCKDCKHRDPEDKKCDCGHDILWQLPRRDDWFCADSERRTDD